MDGNIQQLIFYLSREWISIFSFTFPQKILKLTIIYYGFALIFASCSAYYLFHWFYKTKVKIVIEDFRNNTAGIFHLTVEFGLKNICFGATHFFGRFVSYFTLISILLVGEVIMLVSILFFRYKFTKSLCIMWLEMLLSLLRICFIVTLIIDNIRSEDCQFILIALMIAVFILGIVVGLK